MNILKEPFIIDFLNNVDKVSKGENFYNEDILKSILNDYSIDKEQLELFIRFIDMALENKKVIINKNELFLFLEKSGFLYKKIYTIFWGIDETEDSIYVLMEKVFIEKLKEAILY